MELTGLSRSTVSRVVDELLDARFLVEAVSDRMPARGRPSKRLQVARSLGKVVGIDVGATTTRVLSCDLGGNVIERLKVDTPSDLPLPAFADWFCDLVDGLNAAPEARLRQMVVSFPARVVDGIRIEHPTRALHAIEGAELYARLSNRIQAPISFRRDPDMALLGELHDGKAVGARDAAMIVASTALATSVAIDRKLIGEGKRAIGAFGVMPLTAELTLGDVLSVQGISDRAARNGMRAPSLDEILSEGASPEIMRYRDDFVCGLTQLVFALTLAAEPEVIVLTGRLLPLVAQALPALTRTLDDRLPITPALVLSETGGFSQPRGAVEVALGLVRQSVHEEVTRL